MICTTHLVSLVEDYIAGDSLYKILALHPITRLKFGWRAMIAHLKYGI